MRDAAYALERELGGGGMSRVFVAEERALGCTVVLKVLPPELAAGVSAERFRRDKPGVRGLAGARRRRADGVRLSRVGV